MAVVIAFTGGRPGMISAPTGGMALVMVDLVREHGLPYLFATTVPTAFLPVAAGFLRPGSHRRFVSRSVMTGFVAAAEILVYLAQLPALTDVPWLTYPTVVAGLAIVSGLPRLSTAIPSPIVCNFALTAVSRFLGVDRRTVADTGQLPSSAPVFLLPGIPPKLETLLIILP